jgi:hypothetical protein
MLWSRCHADEHLAEGLRLLIRAGLGLDGGDLGDGLHQEGHLFAEDGFDLLGGMARVLHHVVQKAGGDGDGVHVEIGQELGHFEGMLGIGHPGTAELVLVGDHGEIDGPLDQVAVEIGAALADIGEEVFLGPVEAALDLRGLDVRIGPVFGKRNGDFRYGTGHDRIGVDGFPGFAHYRGDGPFTGDDGGNVVGYDGAARSGRVRLRPRLGRLGLFSGTLLLVHDRHRLTAKAQTSQRRGNVPREAIDPLVLLT